MALCRQYSFLLVYGRLPAYKEHSTKQLIDKNICTWRFSYFREEISRLTDHHLFRCLPHPSEGFPNESFAFISRDGWRHLINIP